MVPRLGQGRSVRDPGTPLRPSLDGRLPEREGCRELGIAPRCQHSESRHPRKGDDHRGSRQHIAHATRETRTRTVDHPCAACDGEYRERCQRQVHPPFRPDLGSYRDDARGWSEQDEEHGTQEADSWPAEQRDYGSGNERRDHDRAHPDIAQRQSARQAIVKYRSIRPERLPQVDADHLGLVQRIRPDGNTGAQADGRMRSQQENHAKRNPRRRQRRVQVPSNGKCLAQ